jgi:hypothetical protein
MKILVTLFGTIGKAPLLHDKFFIGHSFYLPCPWSCLLESWRSFLGKLYLLYNLEDDQRGDFHKLSLLYNLEDDQRGDFHKLYLSCDLEDDRRGDFHKLYLLWPLKMIEEVSLASCIPYNLEDDWRGEFFCFWQVESVRNLKMIEEGCLFFWQVESIINLKMIDHTWTKGTRTHQKLMDIYYKVPSKKTQGNF